MREACPSALKVIVGMPRFWVADPLYNSVLRLVDEIDSL
jgi:hypothetical protein